jgi:hypothetical protein
MKRTIALAIAFAAAPLLDSIGAQSVEGTAVVRALRGSAKYTTGGGVWATVKVGTIFRPGSTILTEAGSSVDFFLDGNGQFLRVTPDTTMTFEKLGITRTNGENVIDTQLNLMSGRILGSVKKLAEASRYEINFPSGRAGIRGATDYDINLVHFDGEKSMVDLSCVTGQVVAAKVFNGGGSTAVLGEGQTWNSERRGPPAPLTRAQHDALKREFDDLVKTK